jgi:molybdopterin molybdotransferase
VLDRVRALESEDVPLSEALGRVLAADVTSADDVPGFDNSAMDGFAVLAADTAGADTERPVELSLAGESRAGRPAERELRAGEAYAISTGAMLPAGADAVVRVEDTRPAAGAVEVLQAVIPGTDIRRAGEDIRAGDRVLDAGRRLGPAELGVAASTGAATVTCARRPAVSFVSTGDELTPPGEPLRPGGVRNTNSFALPAQARRAGADTLEPRLAPDDFAATVEVLRGSLGADVAVITGGVSVGPHDHVKPALAELGVEEVFWGVALRPGKPTWFGVAEGGAPLVFGLPGNPVSAMVTFHLFVRPALAAMMGTTPLERRAEAVFDADYRKQPGRAHVVRCRLEVQAGGWHVRPTKAQGSHVLTSMLNAEAFAYLDVERGDVSAGEQVEIEIL